MNESCRIWISYVAYEWVVILLNESCHRGTKSQSHRGTMSHITWNPQKNVCHSGTILKWQREWWLKTRKLAMSLWKRRLSRLTPLRCVRRGKRVVCSAKRVHVCSQKSHIVCRKSHVFHKRVMYVIVKVSAFSSDPSKVRAAKEWYVLQIESYVCCQKSPIICQKSHIFHKRVIYV